MPSNSNTPEGVLEPRGDESVFAPTPVWARTTSRKRRSWGAARSPAPAPVAQERAPELEDVGAAAVDEPTAVYETRPARRGLNGAAVAAGVVALAAIGGVAWYASQPHGRGMAELTPGSAATSETALNTAAAPSAAQLPPETTAATPADSTTTTQNTVTATRAAATPATTTTTRRTTTVATRTPVHRVRPAASASDQSVNTSVTAPMVATPQPAPAPSQTPTTSDSTATSPMTVNPAPAPAPTTGDTSTAPPATTTP